MVSSALGLPRAGWEARDRRNGYYKCSKDSTGVFRSPSEAIRASEDVFAGGRRPWAAVPPCEKGLHHAARAAVLAAGAAGTSGHRGRHLGGSGVAVGRVTPPVPVRLRRVDPVDVTCRARQPMRRDARETASRPDRGPCPSRPRPAVNVAYPARARTTTQRAATETASAPTGRSDPWKLSPRISRNPL